MTGIKQQLFIIKVKQGEQEPSRQPRTGHADASPHMPSLSSVLAAYHTLLCCIPRFWTSTVVNLHWYQKC
eukprot:365994-Chlamydomonas_euryale.AAC.9